MAFVPLVSSSDAGRKSELDGPAGVTENSSLMTIHPATLPQQQLLDLCDVRRQRRSGPGGQHRNKVETAVVITHRTSGVQGAASERRSQEQNRQVALSRLRINLAIEQRVVPVAKAPSPLWLERLRGKQLSVSPQHDDFPSLLSEALDHLQLLGGDVVTAASQLQTTTSQLLKLLRHQPRAMEHLNELRLQNDLKKMH